MRDIKGSNNPNWKGGVRNNRGDGYIQVYAPDHPAASKHGKDVYQHRLVMEKYIGRYLMKGEVVHHLNGNNSDNRIENLILLKDQKDHARTHYRGRNKKGQFV